MPSDDRADAWFEDILASIDAIRRYVDGMSFDAYLESEITRDAVERRVLVISEAARRLGLLAEERAPGPNWSDIRRIGSIIRHDYGGISHQTIWSVVSIELVRLEHAIRQRS